MHFQRTFAKLSNKSFHQQRRLFHRITNAPPLTLQIWGANTGVGKTVLSAALLATVDKPSLYLKPVQSGYPEDDDSSVVEKHATHARPITLFSFTQPVSPDLAAKMDGVQPVEDAIICSQTKTMLHKFYNTQHLQDGRAAALVETAGGVLSPAPSGSLQADVYRPLRLPALLVGDFRLGGISTTLAAYEALSLRGYTVPAVVLFGDSESQLENEFSIESNLKNANTSIFRAPTLPPEDVPLKDYMMSSEVKQFSNDLYGHLEDIEIGRRQNLENMQRKSKDIYWYPFTQHKQLDHVTCVDSAYGEEFTCYDSSKDIHNLIDAVGSWWTIGVGHGNVDVAKAIAHASGRYGHVMFAEATYEPAFQLAQKLLDGPGKGWASRVFYSDDGSTAVEVALKMAFRKRAIDNPQAKSDNVCIVGLKDSYHGDTLGAMDCCESSAYNSKQTPWFESKGIFFDPPIASIRNGRWVISIPKWLITDGDTEVRDIDGPFSQERANENYNRKIAEHLDHVLQSEEVELGALIIEPLMLGAGGMKIVDPAFQRALVDECRKRSIPVVFDEVFSGLWRLGAESGASILGRNPDIAAYSKLLTGGTVPLSVTLASEDVHHAFDGDSKVEALLHGHSYTAHAIGCAAGVESLRQYESLANQNEKILQYWDMNSAAEISSLDNVKGVSVLGTVLSVEMHSDGEGYAATGARRISEQLLEKGVFARPLGNVIYLLCSPVSDKKICDELMQTLMNILDQPTFDVEHS